MINRKIGAAEVLPAGTYLFTSFRAPMEGWDEGEVSDGLDQPDTPRVAQESGRNEDDPAAALLA